MISNYFGFSSGKSNQSNQTCSLEVNKNCTQTEVPSRINKDELFLKYEDMSSELFAHKCTINSLETQLEYQKKQTVELSNILDATKDHSLFWDLFIQFDVLKPLQRSLISDIISGARYNDLSKGFWIDMYLNLSHRQFNKLAV